MSRNIVGGQVDAICARGDRHIRAGINEQTRFTFHVSRFTNHADCIARQRFEFPGRQVFFAKLDVVNSRARGFCDLGQQALAAMRFVSGKLFAVGDVAEQHLAVGTQHSAK